MAESLVLLAFLATAFVLYQTGMKDNTILGILLIGSGAIDIWAGWKAAGLQKLALVAFGAFCMFTGFRALR